MAKDDPLRTASELAQQGKTAEAIACLEAALALTRSSPERPANTSLLARTAGLFCEEAGQLSQAAAYYEESSAADLQDPIVLLALADVRWRLGEADVARSCLKRAESLVQPSSDPEISKVIAKTRARWA